MSPLPPCRVSVRHRRRRILAGALHGGDRVPFAWSREVDPLMCAGMPPPALPWRAQAACEAALVLAAIVGVAAFVPRLPQREAYHDLADRRPLWGLPNAGNVLSSVVLAAPGALGLAVLWQSAAARGRGRARGSGGRRSAVESVCWSVCFAGMLGVGAASVYYHLAPSTPRLLWDRLCIAPSFAALLAAVVAERRGGAAGATVLLLLASAGVASVWHWHAGEAAGRGDLRWYLLIQVGSGALRSSRRQCSTPW